MICPLIAAGGLIFLFLQQKRNKMPPLRLMLWKVVRGLSKSLPHQPRRKKRERRVCERTICVGIGIVHLLCNPLSLRGGTTKQSIYSTTVRLLRCARNDRKKASQWTGVLGVMHVPLWRGFRGEVEADFFVNIKYDFFLEWIFVRSLPRGGLIFLFLQQKRNKMPPLRLMLWKVVRGLSKSLPHQPRRKKGERRVSE